MIWAVSLLSYELSPVVLTAVVRTEAFGVWLRTLRQAANSHSVALPLLFNGTTLALKLFRREPAISELDWNFSPTHKSSPDIERSVGSGLLRLLQRIHPAHV